LPLHVEQILVQHAMAMVSATGGEEKAFLTWVGG